MGSSQPPGPALAAAAADADPVTLLVTAWLSAGRSESTRAGYARDIGYIAQELAVTRAPPAVDLARALDPLPPSFDVGDLLLSLHPMAQLRDDDDAVKVTISLIEAAEPWANPGRLGQHQAGLAWLEDSSHLDRLDRITSPCLAMAFEHDCWFPRAPCARQPSAASR